MANEWLFTAFKLELLPVQLNVPWCAMIYERLFRFGLWSRSSFSPVSSWPVISKSSACCPFGSFWTNCNLPHSEKASRKDFHGPLGQALPLSSCVSLSCPVLSCAHNFQALARHCDTPKHTRLCVWRCAYSFGFGRCWHIYWWITGLQGHRKVL